MFLLASIPGKQQTCKNWRLATRHTAMFFGGPVTRRSGGNTCFARDEAWLVLRTVYCTHMNIIVPCTLTSRTFKGFRSSDARLKFGNTLQQRLSLDVFLLASIHLKTTNCKNGSLLTHHTDMFLEAQAMLRWSCGNTCFSQRSSLALPLFLCSAHRT